MTQQTILLDPTAERAPSARPRLARPEQLGGRTVGRRRLVDDRAGVVSPTVERGARAR